MNQPSVKTGKFHTFHQKFIMKEFVYVILKMKHFFFQNTNLLTFYQLFGNNLVVKFKKKNKFIFLAVLVTKKILKYSKQKSKMLKIWRPRITSYFWHSIKIILFSRKNVVIMSIIAHNNNSDL